MPRERIVHVVDDDEAARESLGLLLRSFGYTVETYESGTVFLERLPDAMAGCVLLDIHMPGVDGLEVQRQLNEKRVRMAVIVLTGRADVPLAVRAMKAGAVELLEKPYRNDELLPALDEGFRRLETGLGARADDELARQQVERLTRREREVLRGLLAGQPNKLIARDLGLSHRTVELHRAKLMDKLGARGLSGAVRIALAAGMSPAA
jgi:two-component system response regulator FixJ